VSSQTCPNCRADKITRSLPKEIKRQLDHQPISMPEDAPSAKARTIALLRITYRHDFLCSNCGQQWSETFQTESQKQI